MHIKDSVFHKVLRDSLNATLNAPVSTTANHAAICAAIRKMNDRTLSPYIQGRLSAPRSYFEEIRDAKEVVKVGIEKLVKFGDEYLELGRFYHRLGVEYHLFGMEVFGKVKLGASLFLAFATAGAFFYSGTFVYHWWMTAPSPAASLGAYENLVQDYLNKKDFTGALKTLYLMVDHDFVPSRTTFENVLHAILDDKKVNIAGKVLKLVEELEVSVDSKLVCDVIVVLFWKGKAETALKRMVFLSQLDVDRIVDGLIGAEKKPSPMTTLRLLAFLVSKKETVLAVRLLSSGLLCGIGTDSHLNGLLDILEVNQGAVLSQSELGAVKKFREQFLASPSN